MTTAHTPGPFSGIKVIDVTHVLAGPFATYQLAVHGADVIKVEPPEGDMVRVLGGDDDDNKNGMGSAFLTQSSNKRSITLDLKQPEGQEALKKLAATADVLVENFRPHALAALGLGYTDLAKINPRLIYASFSAFGQNGPRGHYTAYDHVIQATSGIMATTGEVGGRPIKFGSPVIDYATGTTGAFALATALFQRERTGMGQHIDMAMMDVALVMMASHVTEYTRTGHHPEPHGHWQGYASGSCWPTKDGYLMLGAQNIAQQHRFWVAIGYEDMAKTTHAERRADEENEKKVVGELLLTRTANEWEDFFQSRHIPAGRVRRLEETLQDPHLAHRSVLHEHKSTRSVGGSFTVPLAAFKLAHGGARIDMPPPTLGQHTDTVLAELGYSTAEISAMRDKGTI
ncbi:MAG: CoA transferase [Acetobacteraceae bacterium]|nr:CoA transferase [Acetobacteraceae bacterium]MSP29701.1 CoA transferase [Acetobacteraceae bacterium]